MILKGNETTYELGPMVAQDDRFNIHLCTKADDVNKSFLLVAAQEGMNSVVDRWGFVLKELAQRATRLEEEYALIRKDLHDVLNYQLGFPVFVDSFKSPKKRQILILAFANSEPSAMVPIARMIQRDKLRIDMKTSVWMMGKLLKILAFAHDQGISVGPIHTGKILIDPDKHYVNFFDWSETQISVSLGDETKRTEISDAAMVIIEALGGDASNRTIPNNEGDEGERYSAHLWTLVDALLPDAATAHKRFYEFVEKLWTRKFHPFTTFRRGN